MPRIVIYQGRPAGRIPPRHLARIAGHRPDFLCLPEYFWVPAGARDHGEAVAWGPVANRALGELSRELACVVVGGSYVEAQGGRLHNTAPVYDRGRLAGSHRKVRLMPREAERGIHPGDGFHAIEAGGLRLGVVICADVLDRASFRAMRDIGAEIVFAPTLSPWRADDTLAAKDERDRGIFAAGAVEAGAAVVKACGVGRIFGSRLQGRSLVASPAGDIVARVPPGREGRVAVLSVEL